MVGLQGKVAVITGGGVGIGKAIASALANDGAAVALLGRREDRLKETLSDIIAKGGKGTYIACDVRNAASIRAAADHVRNEYGRVDILINNAGTYDGDIIDHTSQDEWDTVMETNLRGPFLVTKAFLPTMKARGDGWIINMSSWAGKDVAGGHTTYAASKWGLRGWSECLGQELKECGIRVAGIYPGSVNTAMQRGVPAALEPADIAQCVQFLVSLPKRAYVDDLTIVPTEYY